MPVSIRTRFEVFKRDSFTCRYCGRQSPEVVLEIDHIVPTADGGSDDRINLTTSCWQCNRGKSHIPLTEVIAGEDPHDRAVLLLEQERQLKEYNRVLTKIAERREREAWKLVAYWKNDQTVASFNRRELAWLINTLKWLPSQIIRDFMDAAVRADCVRDLRYVKACVKRHREQREIELAAAVNG